MQSNRGYGHVTANQVGNEAGKKKKFVIIGVSSLILVAMVVAVAVGVTHNNDDSNQSSPTTPSGSGDANLQTSMKAIQAICQPTDYKQTCIDNLSKAAGNATDPRDLVKIAFNVTMSHIREAAKHSTVLQELEKDPRSTQALENCKELMDYAISDLQDSFEQFDKLDLSMVDELLAELKIWLSAAITYQETCLDGFENTTGHAGESMRKALNSSGELTSNALAIVTEISSILTSLDIPIFNRRLLSKESEIPNEDGFPGWVSNGKRKLLADPLSNIKPDVVVAKDGSGQFKTITEALNVVPQNSNQTFVIYIKEGVYEEHLLINKSTTHLMMIGDGQNITRITGNKNFIDGTPTFKTATVAVVGDNFMAKDIGFENSAGPEKHQAVALRVQSDMSIFFKCQMDGYQDTLYVHTHRQFYRSCSISGTIDFIFGNAAVVFQHCNMVVRKPLDNQQNIVTAQGRKDEREPTGIVIQDCTIKADPLLAPVRHKIPSYLGRPWKEYSRTIVMFSMLNDLIHPDGWLPWMGDFGLDTCYYGEFGNRGPRASLIDRVKWKGIRTITNDIAVGFTAANFIDGDSWVKTTGVPYTSGLQA